MKSDVSDDGNGPGGDGPTAREELLALTRQLKEHVSWLERGGVVGVPPAPPSALRAAVSRAPSPPQPAGSRAPAPRGDSPREDSSSPSPTPRAPVPAGGVGAVGLQVVRDELGDCQRCKLAPKRTQLVWGVGNPEAALVFVGEAPGADEDRTGEPFVGAAGQLLTKMIEAMGLSRQDVYICNILKCRPPGNRNPEPDEILQCEPFLKQQLAAIRPRMIVALGKFAAQCLLRSDAPISRLRGSWREYEGIPLMPTYHPAFLLRTPSAKRDVWNDLQQVMSRFDELGLPRAAR
jgi:uracil-DNA glycosylase family 4